jgi:hypothetical protein
MPLDEWKNYQGEITLNDNYFDSCGVCMPLPILIRDFEKHNSP